MVNFTFRFEDHTYWLNGERIPGFSEVAKATGLVDLSMVKDEVLEANGRFGTAVHKMTALWDQGILDVDNLDPVLLPYLEGYQKFLKLYDVEILPEWIERPTFSAKWRFACTPDRPARVGGKLTILEYKSSEQFMPVIEIQTAAQKVCFEEQTGLKIQQRWGVKILAGECKPNPHTSLTDETVFLSSLNNYRWRMAHKLIKEA